MLTSDKNTIVSTTKEQLEVPNPRSLKFPASTQTKLKMLVRDNAVAYFTQYRLNVLNFSLVADKVDYLYLATRTIPK